MLIRRLMYSLALKIVNAAWVVVETMKKEMSSSPRYLPALILKGNAHPNHAHIAVVVQKATHIATIVVLLATRDLTRGAANHNYTACYLMKCRKYVYVQVKDEPKV